MFKGEGDGTLSFYFLKNVTKNKMFQKKQMTEQISNQILCPYNPKVVASFWKKAPFPTIHRELGLFEK